MADFERDDDMPLSGEEKRRLKRRNPTGKAPEDLAALDESAPPSKTVKFIDRAAVRKSDAPATLEGCAPPWVGVSFAPKRAGTPPPPTVTHRGERLDPHSSSISPTTGEPTTTLLPIPGTASAASRALMACAAPAC